MTSGPLHSVDGVIAGWGGGRQPHPSNVNAARELPGESSGLDPKQGHKHTLMGGWVKLWGGALKSKGSRWSHVAIEGRGQEHQGLHEGEDVGENIWMKQSGKLISPVPNQDTCSTVGSMTRVRPTSVVASMERKKYMGCWSL